MKDSKFDWKGYFAPTPKLFRRAGNTLFMMATTLGGYAITHDNPIWMWIVVGLGVLGKALTTFFVDVHNGRLK